MIKGKRRRLSAEFKAKVALEVLRGKAILAELATRFEVHPTMIGQWKRQASEGLVEVFNDGSAKREEVSEAQTKELHAKIGQLTIERDFWSGPSVVGQEGHRGLDRLPQPARNPLQPGRKNPGRGMLGRG
jgi:transposase